MRSKLKAPRRPSLDLATEYKALGRVMRDAEARMHEIKSQVIAKGGKIETAGGMLAIEHQERRNAPSITALTEAGWYDKIAAAGLIKTIKVEILRVIETKAS